MTTEKAPSALRLAQMYHKLADDALLVAKRGFSNSEDFLNGANIWRMRAFELEAEARERMELGLEP